MQVKRVFTTDEPWGVYMTTRDRIEAMERELHGLRDQLAWTLEYSKRLANAIDEKQEALDLEVAELLKQK